MNSSDGLHRDQYLLELVVIQSALFKIQMMMPTMPPDAHKISLKIIEAIKQHPVLYISDVKGSAIKLQEFRQKVWRRISNELGLDPAWVRLRWKNLRDTYCRILKYKNKSDKGTRRKKWIFEDHLNFIKFPYEPDYQPQCVELSDEYIEEINSSGMNSENLLEQLDDRNDEDYSEYLEVLEETTADPILAENEQQQQQLTTEILDNNGSQSAQQDIDAYVQQIQSKYRKIRPKRIKLESCEQSTDDTDVTNNYGILSPSFKIEQLKLPTNNNATVSPILITSATTPINSTVNQDIVRQESLMNTAKVDNIYSRSVGKTSIELFFNSMAQTVKLFPPQAQAEIKMSVCRIVTEAEVKYSKKISSKNVQRFIAPRGMIPKLVLIPCSMIDNPEDK